MVAELANLPVLLPQAPILFFSVILQDFVHIIIFFACFPEGIIFIYRLLAFSLSIYLGFTHLNDFMYYLVTLYFGVNPAIFRTVVRC